MDTHGTVRSVNTRTGMVAVSTGGGSTVFELIDACAVEVGDAVSWTSGTDRGVQTYSNCTRGEEFWVYVQDHHLSPGQPGRRMD